MIIFLSHHTTVAGEARMHYVRDAPVMNILWRPSLLNNTIQHSGYSPTR
jgi:hypothetical protein